MADNCSYSLASSSVFKIVQTLTVKTRRKLTSLFLKMIVQQLDIGYIYLEFGKIPIEYLSNLMRIQVL